MSIEVILKEHVEHLGRRGEIVKVADGYARNFLFPRKLALAVTDGEQAADRARAGEGRSARGREVKERAGAGGEARGGRDLRSPAASARTTTLYGSVTSADIADALAARELTVDRRKIQLPEPLKTLGEHRCRSSCTAT